MSLDMKSPVMAASRFSETMPADATFATSHPPHQIQALQRQLEIERDIKAELQAQLKEEEQYRRKIEAERDREKAMRQAAESQAAIWQETEKKMRRDLEKSLAQEEQRRREIEQDRDKAHNQRRAAEVDMTVARQQLVAEVQLRRDAEEKLMKERDQNEWVAKVKELEEQIQSLQDILVQQKADAGDVQMLLQKQKEEIEAELADEKEKVRLLQAELERTIEELKQTELQKAVQLADVENLRRTASRDIEAAQKSAAQAKKDMTLAWEKQEAADKVMEEARALKTQLAKELEELQERRQSMEEAEAQAKEAISLYEQRREEGEKVYNAARKQKLELDMLAGKLDGERLQLEQDKAANAAAREEWHRTMQKTQEQMQQWEKSKVHTQRLWAEWLAASVEAITNPGTANFEAAEAAKQAYVDAEVASEPQFAELLADDQSVANEWGELVAARMMVERQVDLLQSLQDEHAHEKAALETRVAELHEDLGAAQAAEANAKADADLIRQELETMKDEYEKEKEDLVAKEEDLDRDRKDAEEFKENINSLAKQLESAQAELEVEQRQWEQDKVLLLQEKEALEAEREELRKQIEAERSEMQEEQRAWEQERIRLDRLIADMEREKQNLEERMAVGSPTNELDMKLLSITSNEDAMLRGAKPMRSELPGRSELTGRSELPGLSDLREEFETFRRERREAWTQGRKAHEQQERQWLQNYLGAAIPSPGSNRMGPSQAFTHPGLRPAGKVADWNAFRAVVIPVGTLVHLKTSFQRLNLDGSGMLDLHKLSWVERQNTAAPSIQAETLRSMIINMDATHSGIISFWEFVGVQLFLLLHLGERGFDFREWQTFVAKSWHPNHFQTRGIPRGANGTGSPMPRRDVLMQSYPGP